MPLRQRQEVQKVLRRLTGPPPALTLTSGAFAHILPPPANLIRENPPGERAKIAAGYRIWSLDENVFTEGIGHPCFLR